MSVVPELFHLAIVGNDCWAFFSMQLAILIELHVGIVAFNGRKIPTVEVSVAETQDGPGVLIDCVVHKGLAMLVSELLPCKMREPRYSLGLLHVTHRCSLLSDYVHIPGQGVLIMLVGPL
jgi:hypothetical protein